MDFLESIKLAFRSVRSNVLRATLTLFIIAFGIMALVGILTSIDSAVHSLSTSFSSLGANAYTIVPLGRSFFSKEEGAKRGPSISYQQAMDFKERYRFPAKVSTSFFVTALGKVRYEETETDPNVIVRAADEAYLDANARELEAGRFFSAIDARDGTNRAVIGADVVEKLFGGEAQQAINQIIAVGNVKLKVIGVLKEKGASIRLSDDRVVLIPLFTGKRLFGTTRTNYKLKVASRSTLDIENSIASAMGLFRNIRGLRISEENDFEMIKDDRLMEIIEENTVYFRSAAVGIGIITLLGAAIGLMNIMLVSVTERTREIGVLKAIGANRRNILSQFLIEAILICQMGGIVGIILGILMGNIVSIFLEGPFYVPWNWMILSLVVCTVVGLIAGLYPAIKAARLDPIESLRYE